MSWYDLLLGRLDWSALPFWAMLHNPTRSEIVNGIIASGAAGVVVLGALAVMALLTVTGRWCWLWSEWLTSVDHKRIGIMYVVLSLVMLTRAVIEACLMRTQQAAALGGGFLSPDHFAQLFSTHGSIMIFFMAMPFLTGLMNYVVPLQIGARDVSFPVLNSVGLGLTAAGAGIVMISLVLGDFSTGGWSGYWSWSVTLSLLGTTLTGINIACTIWKERCLGMRLMRMPMFCWTSLCTSILMIFAMPPLTVVTAMLALDRYLGFHFFTNALGGNMMNYANLFWLFGHPEVYILLLPALGIYSETFSTFLGKTLYGYTSLVIATMAIAILSWTVWLHHFFTMGQSSAVNAAFGLATMTIGVPTGVKVYDWLLTMWRGRVRVSVPMIYALGFMSLFVIGGLTGIILANPSVDYQVHNSLFLVAHFHNMLIPATLFGLLAGTNLWFPKAFGFRLDERWGRVSALCWIGGFMLAFFPLYALGMMGMPRRTVAYLEPAWLPWTSAALVFTALVSLMIQLWVSVRDREALAVPAGDPWDGRSNEWATSSPPPEWNFPVLPEIEQRDQFMHDKETSRAYRAPERYEDIEMPRGSVLGVLVAVFGAGMAFGLTWHMWGLAILSAVILFASVILRGFARRTTKLFPAAEVRAHHETWLALVATTPPILRGEEQSRANRGRSIPAALEPAE